MIALEAIQNPSGQVMTAGKEIPPPSFSLSPANYAIRLSTQTGLFNVTKIRAHALEKHWVHRDHLTETTLVLLGLMMSYMRL